MADRKCAVCGSSYQAPPSDKTVTCCKTCSSIHRSRIHLGKRNSWSPEARARLAAKGQTANLRKGTAAATASPKSGPYETNVGAATWIVTSPRGEVYRVRNLALWCRTNRDLFAPASWRRVYAGLLQAAAYLRGATTRRVGGYKGWRITQPGLPEDGERELIELAANIERIAREKLT